MKLKFLSIIFLITITLQAQNRLDSILTSIANHNKTIITNTKYWEAKTLAYQTGLSPSDPKVDYDYLIGTPANAGNQTDFAITQAFDFPSAYRKKKELSNEQIKQAEFQLIEIRQNILLQSKLLCIELTYLNKLESELNKRLQNTIKWQTSFQKKLDKGEGNMLDVNKAKLQIIALKATLQENTSLRNQLTQKLTELNAGNEIEYTDTIYYSLPIIIDFETLENEIEEKDPVRMYLEQEKKIGQAEIALTKSLSLPKLEAGYHYQSILGQRFNGLHMSATIPLWENKNKLQTKQAELLYQDANLKDHANEHYYHTQQKYEQLTNLKTTLNEYQPLFSSMNNIELLDKSLAFGQITTLEYFMETSYYYEAYKNYLKTEETYHKVMAELFKYKL
jgi:outer membrane protein TolC